MNQSTFLLAIQDSAEFTGDIGIVHANGHIIFLANGECRKIHDIQFLFVTFIKSDGIVFGSGGVLFGVSGIDAVHAGTFQQQVGTDFHSTQSGTRVGSKERIACTSGENHHLASLQIGDSIFKENLLANTFDFEG